MTFCGHHSDKVTTLSSWRHVLETKRVGLLAQNDGPMLEALKELRGTTVHSPNRTRDRPDRDRLAMRFGRFVAAT